MTRVPQALNTQAPILDQYKSTAVKENVWKGRMIRTGIALGVTILLATAIAMVAFGVLSANPLLIGLGLALGTCVLIGAISYFSIHKALPDQELRVLQRVKSSVFDVEHEPIGPGLEELGELATS